MSQSSVLATTLYVQMKGKDVTKGYYKRTTETFINFGL